MGHIGMQIRALMRERGISNKRMAEHCGVTPGAVSNWLTTGTITKVNLAKACALMGVSMEALLAGGVADLPDPRVQGAVPLLSGAQAAHFRDVLKNKDVTLEKIATTVPVSSTTFAMRAHGDSMEPRITAGMVLIVEPEMESQDGDFVIVTNGPEATMCRQLVLDGQEWLLKPINSRYPIRPLGVSRIIGVVRAVTEQFR